MQLKIPSRRLVLLMMIAMMVSVANWLALGGRYPQAVPQVRAGGAVLPTLLANTSTVSEIELASGGSRFRLTRSNGGWANQGIGGYPAQTSPVTHLIDALAGLRYLEPKTERSALYRKLQVEDISEAGRSTRIVLKNSVGTVLADLIAGKSRARLARFEGPGLYIRLTAESRAWLVAGALDLHRDAISWSDNTLVDIDADALTKLTVTREGGETVILHRTQTNDAKLTLQNLPPGYRVEHQFQIDYMAGLLQKVTFDDARRAVSDGVDRTSAFTATVLTQDGLTITLGAAKPAQDGSVWVTVDAASAPGASESARAQMARINRRFDTWQVQLARKFGDRLQVRRSDIMQIDAKLR